MAGGADTVFAYLREADGERLLVALNFTDAAVSISLPEGGISGTVLCSTDPDRTGVLDLLRIDLAADEGLVVRIS